MDSLAQVCDIIKENIDIVDFCERQYNSVFIESNNQWFNTHCLLPTHEDNNPSFGVNANNNTFKCFGCGEKGSVIDLVMKVEGINLNQAVQYLLNYLNIQPNTESQHFYNLHRLLSNVRVSTNKDVYLDAKIKQFKRNKANIDFELYYKNIIELFNNYDLLNAEGFKNYTLKC